MKLLKRNETEFTYTAYAGKTEIMKDQVLIDGVLTGGKHTGKYELTYESPVTYRGNISAPYGQDMQQLFGVNTPYTHVLLMDDPDADIREDGLIQWKDNVYEVKAVRPSLNVLAIALRKRTAGET